MREWSHPYVVGCGPSIIEWEYSASKVNDNKLLKILTQRGAYLFHTPQWSCYHDPVTWVVMAFVQSTIQWHLWAETSIPLSNTCNPVDIHPHYTLPDVFIHLQWMLWLMSMGEGIAFHWSTPGKSSWVDTGWSPDHHLLVGILTVTPSGSRFDWNKTSTSVPTWWTKGKPCSEAIRRSQLWCRMCGCLCWSVTSYEGMSVMTWCTTSWGLSSHLSLIFLFPWRTSALTKTRSPSFNPMAPIF